MHVNSRISVEEWSEYLRHLARPVLEAGEAARERLESTPLVSAFMRWHDGIGTPCRAGSPDGSVTGEADVLLWSALTDPTIRVADLIERLAADGSRGEPDAGSLLPQGLHRTLEVWTEAELASLHALSWLAAVHDRSDWSRLAERVAAWHVEHMQPDNATHHPWGVHVFLRRRIVHGDLEAGLYAESMLHNCRVTTGRPDALSAFILADAASALGRPADGSRGVTATP